MKRLYEKKDHLIRRNPNLTDEQKSEIIAVLNKYPNLESNIDWNKSSSLTYEDFKLRILDNAGKSNSQAKRRGLAGLVEGEDYDILSSKDGETLYAVYSHLASKTLASNRVEPKIWTESKVMNWDSEDEFSGRKVYRNEKGELVELKPGAKWCIAMNDPEYWNDYCLKRDIAFYFLFREDKSLEDKEKKIAISVDSRYKEIITYTFGDDTSMRDYTLSEEYKNLIFNNLSKYFEKIKQNIRKDLLVLNPQTNRYDCNGDLGNNVIKYFISEDRDGFTINFGEVKGDFKCSGFRLKSLKGAPLKVGKRFNCSDNELTSLEGAPKEVGRSFDCSYNRLTSLKGAPQKVSGYFDCRKNKLTSLEGALREISGYFCCSGNQLTSLGGAPKTVSGDFDCSDNQLTSLEGSPKEVGRSFDCSYNRLTSLKGAPQKINGVFDCFNNHLTSLEGAPQKVEGYFNCSGNMLTSLKGAPKEVDISFICSTNQLTSLEGAPEYIGINFDCSNNPNLHSLEGIGKVKGLIYKDF